MAIEPPIQKGLDAYRRGDWHAAHLAWERAAAAEDGVERRRLLSALADLAASLEREQRGLHHPAEELLEATRGELEGLPDRVLGVDVGGLRDGIPEDPAVALEAPPEVPAARSVPPWVLGRFVLFVVLIGAGFVILRFTPVGDRLNELLERERLIELRATLRSQWWWTAPALVASYVVLAPLGAPVSPLMFAGGAIFGTLVGSVLNILGTFLGAAGSFFLARWLGRDFVTHVVGDRLKRAERLVARRGFWTWVRIRFLPIPFPVVNYGAALAGVPAALFLIATGIGLIPANIVYTYFAAALFEAVGGGHREVLLKMAGAVIALLTLSFLPNVLEGRRRRRRLDELRAVRRRQGRSRRRPTAADRD